MIHVSVHNDHLVLQADIQKTDFDTFYGIMRAPGSGAYWEKKERLWRIKAATWDRLFAQLEDLDLIIVDKYADEFLEKARSVPEHIHVLDSGFNLHELVKPPLVGKHPYEDFQVEDLYELMTHNRIGLFNEQGTGKSWELISMAHLRYVRGESKKIIFYTSNSGVYNIKLEFAKFSTIPQDRIAVASVNNRRPFDDPGIDVVITNYGTMRMVEAEYRRTKNNTEGPRLKFTKAIRKWLGNDPGTLITDEAQNMSNFEAQQSDIAHHINEMVYYAYPATGTPADKEQKWYSLLRFLDFKLVKNMTYGEWCAEYFFIGNKHSTHAIGEIRPEKKVELQTLVDKYCIRRFANDVLNLPPHLMKDVFVPMSEIQKRIYQHVVVNGLTSIQNEFQGLPTDEIEREALGSMENRFPFLILALDNPKLLLKHEEKIADPELVEMIRNFDFSQDHSKLDALFDVLEKHSNGEKIIIWNSHPSVGKELMKILKRWKPIILNGETKPPKGMALDEYKAKVIADFQESTTQNVLILGMQVMNSSVNIVKANVQVVYDVNYNFVEFDQMMKRVHRNGQVNTVYTYFLIMDRSLDVARRMNLREKDWVNRKFLTEEYLTLDTAKALFNLSAQELT